MQYVFAVHEASRTRFKEYEAHLKFHYLPAAEIDVFSKEPSVIRRASAEMHYMLGIAALLGAKQVLIMQLEPFQLEISRWWVRRSGVQFSGILFFPFCREFESGATWKDSLRREFRGLRKTLQTYWMLQNPNLKTVYFLNDPEAVATYNQRFGSRFRYLPDPIQQVAPPDDSVASVKKRLGVPEDKFVCLIYGHLSPRKNIPNILKSLAFLPESVRSRMCLLIAGEVEPGYEAVISPALREAGEAYPELTIVNMFEFVGPERTGELFVCSDTILIPYLNFYGSSNIIGLAAKYGKPLVGSSLGLIGKLIGHYRLGVRVAPDKPAAIAEGILDCLHAGSLDPQNAEAYLKQHTTEQFSQALLMPERVMA